ncbi:MAG: glucose-6-phosphate isomerase [Deltaproteobacteria bacterium]|jgi:glucose-6-phosphate isomerase|nr:glucose-6-phosphate isomerase [Deltaproteobacteria bacterium]
MAGRTQGSKCLLKVDYNNLTAQAVGSAGLAPEELNDLKASASEALNDVLSRHKKGDLPFMDLPLDEATARSCQRLADRSRRKCRDVVVLGIGGSALGTAAIYTAVKPLNYHRLPEENRHWPRLSVADNIDPEGFQAVLENMDLEKTCFNVISKSGATAETMSQFMIIFDLLRRKLGPEEIVNHLVVTTDPKNGVLRKIVKAHNLVSFEVPPGVGGRFSVLTAVGLVPLAMAGVNIKELLAGALSAREDGLKSFSSNIAALIAGLNWYMTTKKGRASLVLMPYADSLAKVADWFGQLWNESLGKARKLDGQPANSGQTAIKAVGATDQHSQLQLYMEGPSDKTVMFLGTEKFRKKQPIPDIFSEYPELAYLGGRNLGELLEFERKGTARALAENGRPNLTLTMPEIRARTIGYLIQTLELATVISGSLYGIDPLDQPGVELGKKFTYGLMGRPGFDDFLDRYNKGNSANRKFILP